jgi:lysophospholipase L1-like esterase
MLLKSVLTFACVLFSAVAFGASAADTPSGTAPGAVKAAMPWEQAFAAFADEDASHPHPAGGVLFVGSSSIRLWSDLQDQFKDLPVVINRGFGGSELADCVKNLNRLVIRYRPSTVLVYAGDNDLAAGTTPQEVLHRFTAFVEGVRRELPETRIAYISIKPSPLRVGLLPQIKQTNALIRDYTEGLEKVAFIDVYTPMLDSAGKPRTELFRADSLHLNADGYALWKRVIGPHVH